MSLFSNVAKQQGWTRRIDKLLQVEISTEGHSHICKCCRSRIVSIEKTLEDLVAFKAQAKSCLASTTRGSLKRAKESGSLEGGSPDMLPQWKRPDLQSILK